MSITLDTSGFDRFRRNLERVSGDNRVKLPDLMPDSFMREHTNFQTLQAMLDAGGIETDEEIDSDAFSQFIAAKTKFDGWQDMCQFASGEWVKRQLAL